MVVLALLASAHASPWPWDDTVPTAPRAVAEERVPWHDALDASLGARVTSDGMVSAELSLRWRLDASAYLARARADARDLALHAGALERQAWLRDQLELVARGCESAWRALQAELIDGATDGELASVHPPETLRELELLRALLTLGSRAPAAVDPLASCRLDALVVGLELAPDHPGIVEAAAAARLAERSAALLDAPAPVSAWLQADAAHDAFGARSGVRVGLDVPLDVRLGAAELTLASDGRAADAAVRWVHGAGAAPRQPAWQPAETTRDLRATLEETLSRRRLETALQRVEADRRWALACGSPEATAIASCLERPVVDIAGLDARLAAIDAELTVLHRVLATIEASGRALLHLVPPAP